jgi:ATP-dependent helicase YprA (DUF1998 family)/very-short-patch-repair endonuclease
MDVFDVHERLIADYAAFTDSLVQVRDGRIKRHLDKERLAKSRWPDPRISLNPAFATGGTVGDLVGDGILHPGCERFFRAKTGEDDPGARPLTLHRHQADAIRAARGGDSYVLTTGTGSGKSLAYIIPIVDAVLRAPRPDRISAIVVYPMNALANSQQHELEKYLTWGIAREHRAVSFARYTGQETDEQRDRVLGRRPDILLTNYVMLEYLLTRPRERERLIGGAQGLRFLVLDELHTYRGRQGADVALLVRRLRDACAAPALQCVGTSATMATGESFANVRETVAGFASRLFGTPVRPDRVIGESLERATADRPVEAPQLAAAVDAAASGRRRRAYEELTGDALAMWVENTFGLTHDDTGRLVRQQPTTLPAAAASLAARIGRPAEACAAAIEAILVEGAAARHPDHGRPLFAFRLHQFLSKGDTVHVSLESADDRYLTSQYQVSVPGRRDKILLPLAFCRECGQEYLVVSRSREDGRVRYGSRAEADQADDERLFGHLYVSADHPWPDDPIAAGRLPDTWYATGDDGRPYVLPRLVDHLPREVWVHPDGFEAQPGEGLRAWFLPGLFRFCLRCRVSYEQLRVQDFAKLATFAAEGRSSAVSLISTSVVRSLREQIDLPDRAKKLLTFVDNRQDASLQAGHLNDFVQVTQLRGALYHAARAAGERGLRHDDVAERVTAALDLPISAFSAIADPMFSQKDNVLSALRQAVAYRVYGDLERGWRVTMPNLEQTGLLLFDYLDLDEIAKTERCWAAAHPLLRDDEPAHRATVARILLDEMRRGLAVDADELTQDGYDKIVRNSAQLLTGPWAVADEEPRVQERLVLTRSGGRGGPRETIHLTGRGAFGRYLRRSGEFRNAPGNGAAGRVTVDDAHAVIVSLLEVLTTYGLTIEVDGPHGARGYRVRAAALIWRAGDGTRGAPDPLRKVVDPEVGTRVNTFFRDLYAETADRLSGLVAHEHTAQVPAPLRVQREEAFRRGGDPSRGGLPLLYCSPTMELGVDIAELNAVAMRNVPPTPANYAQRSGRAGRSGQPALVVTYCSTGSAHDQYYFRRSDLMVAGSVTPPRLDLANEDLVRSHVHAIWLAETGAPLHRSMADVLVTAADPDGAAGEPPPLEIQPNLAAQLADPGAGRRAIERGESVLRELTADGAELRRSTWWYDGWVRDVVNAAPRAFDAACDRWRQMYRLALADQREQNRRVLSAATDPKARTIARGRRAEAENRLRLLLNEDPEQLFSDFYSYRYFASEGFLPGYSFPRLPLAAYMPGRRGRDGAYVQRPRFIAVGEFGPGALVYHEGGRYQVKRVQVPGGGGPGEIATTQARLCGACGYWHDRDIGTNRCEECGAALGGAQAGLMHLQTVTTVRRRRISSDEEERRRSGFELLTTFRFATHGARPGRHAATILGPDGTALGEYVYGDTATVRVINRGRRNRADRNDVGFWLDATSGEWVTERRAGELTLEEAALEEAAPGDLAGGSRAVKVVPYVEDRRNIAVVRLAEPVPAEVAVTVRYALERGIEAAFQLEDAELTSQALPDSAGRGRMLFVESAEGGAGVLRRLHDEPGALAQVAKEALQIIHVDPATGADLDRAPGARERCERGCYDCLLSYTNQPDHTAIDRLAAVPLLRALAGSVAEADHGHPGGAVAHVEELADRADSDLERRLLRFLRAGGYRLPDATQELVAGATARPDFVYHLAAGDVAVFVDGPHHDAAEVRLRDAQAEDRLSDRGWLVIRFRYDEEWEQIVTAYPSVFGSGRGGR